jgi:restriction system protein
MVAIPGRFLLYVECKCYSRSNPVGVEVVREILGVVHQGRATAGMIVTTSYFTTGAYDIANADPYRLGLHNYHRLLGGLRLQASTVE